MDFKDFTATIDDDSKRLDRIVKRIFQDSPEINCHEIIRKRLVRINDGKAKSETKIHEGDKVSIASFLFSKTKSPSPEPGCPVIDFKIIFQNDHVLIIDKPAGIGVQPSENQSFSLCDIIAKQFPGGKDSLSFKTGPLHRLDRNTTGLLAFSQSSAGAQWFSSAIKNHEIKKTYVGIAEGFLKEKITWNDFIEESPSSSGNFHTMRILAKGSSSPLKAITHATPLAYGKKGMNEYTLIQYDIETGRKHQIRCQSSYHGFPLLGDNAYGGHGNKFYLHAAMLRFPENNPIDLPKELKCDIPDDFKKNLDLVLLNWDGELIISN